MPPAVYPPPIWQLVAQLLVPLVVGGGFGLLVSRLFDFRTSVVVLLAGVAVEMAWMIVQAERTRREFERDMQRFMKDAPR